MYQRLCNFLPSAAQIPQAAISKHLKPQPQEDTHSFCS